MKTLTRNSLRVVLAVILLIVVVLLYLQFGATRVHHDQIEAAASEAIGFDVSVSEPFTLTLGKLSEITATDVSLAQDGHTVAEIGSLRFTVGTTSVFSGTIEVNSFGIEDAAFFGAQIGEVSGSITRLSGTAVIKTDGDKPGIGLTLHAGDIVLRMADAESDAEAIEQDGRVFSDEPIDLTALRELNFGAHITAKSIRFNELLVTDVRVDASIDDGSLHVESARLTSGEGTASGALSLVPQGEMINLLASTDIDNLRIAALAVEGQDPAELPPLDLTVELEGVGQSAHEIVASANGKITGRHASGQLDLNAAGALFSDLVTSIARTLNPLAEDREFTTLECGIYDIVIVDGIATAEELAAQTDHLTVISSGTINLGTEEIDLTLSTKSREGLGLSLGGVANSFVKVGGTLKEPALNVDAAGSAATTGAAVATGGLSILAKSLWDRLSAEADLCAEEAPQEK